MIKTTLEDLPLAFRQWHLETRERINANTHFRAGGENNHDYDWEIYVRRTRHAIHGQIYPTIDLATIGVKPPLRRQGIACRIIEIIEQEAVRQGSIVYVENVINPNLELYLRRRGYQGVDYDNNFGPTLAVDPTTLTRPQDEELAPSAPTT